MERESRKKTSSRKRPLSGPVKQNNNQNALIARQAGCGGKFTSVQYASPPSKLSECKKLVAIKHYDVLPEEPQEEEINDSKVQPVILFRASVPCLSGSGFTENTSSQPASCVTSDFKESGSRKPSKETYPAVQVPLIPGASKGCGTPESGTSCIEETESSLNSEDDEEDDHVSSCGSTTLSSLPSPEIFRKEMSANTSCPKKDELLGVHVKNSTLLEHSDAQNIHMHHPPNLSTIIDASTILAEKMCEISYHKPENESKTDKSSCKSGQAFERETPPKLLDRKPIFYKKKVWFKSPIITKTQKPKDITSSPPSSENTSNSSSAPQKTKPHPMTSPRRSLVSSNDETLPLAVTLKRPVKTCSEKPVFFHFVNDSDREAFFQKMRERSVKLRDGVFFPFKLDRQNP